MKGGARPNSGRKPKIDEDKVVNQSTEAIIAKYGSIEKGFIALLESGEASLIKFVFEHAVGKPKEKMELSGPQGAALQFIFNAAPGCEPIPNDQPKDN